MSAREDSRRVNDWLATLADVLERDGAAVRVVVAAVRGSAPREPGACLLVTRGAEAPTLGTIGGGHLEWKAIDVARGMFDSGTGPDARLDRFALGATLGQCCGGAVELWFERWDATEIGIVRDALAARERGPVTLRTRLEPGDSLVPRRTLCVQSPGRDTVVEVASERSSGADGGAPPSPRAWLEREPGAAARHPVLNERLDGARPQLWVFGAGHVGTALVRVLGTLPLDVHWIDAREAQLRAGFPDGLPPKVAASVCDDPAREVASAAPGTFFVVMTHSHDLDFEIARALLTRDDFAWAGVIGSATKARRFAQRLERRGFARERVARIACPIGVPGIEAKDPASIAVAVAAQLLQVIEARGRGHVDTRDAAPGDRPGALAGSAA